MNYFDFVILYFANLFIGAIAITGWYAITRGHWETCPDGKKKFVGKIFKGWLKFWEKEKGKNTVYYQGEELKRLMMQLEPILGLSTDKSHKNQYYFADTRIYLTPTSREIIQQRGFIAELQREIKFKIFELDLTQVGSGFVAYAIISKDFEDYVFPEWVRSPMSSCIYCHSSVYGSIMWLLLGTMGKNFLHVSIPDFVYFIFWPIYCFSLSFILPWLNKKI